MINLLWFLRTLIKWTSHLMQKKEFKKIESVNNIEMISSKEMVSTLVSTHIETTQLHFGKTMCFPTSPSRSGTLPPPSLPGAHPSFVCPGHPLPPPSSELWMLWSHARRVSPGRRGKAPGGQVRRVLWPASPIVAPRPASSGCRCQAGELQDATSRLANSTPSRPSQHPFGRHSPTGELQTTTTLVGAPNVGPKHLAAERIGREAVGGRKR